jgi:hypothetical protein
MTSTNSKQCKKFKDVYYYIIYGDSEGTLALDSALEQNFIDKDFYNLVLDCKFYDSIVMAVKNSNTIAIDILMSIKDNIEKSEILDYIIYDGNILLLKTFLFKYNIVIDDNIITWAKTNPKINKEIIDFLVEYLQDPDIILKSAIKNSDIDILKEYCEIKKIFEDYNDEDEDEDEDFIEKILNIAVELGNICIIEWVLANNYYMHDPLIERIILHKNLDLLKYVITKHNLEMMVYDNDISYAKKVSSDEIVQYLIELNLKQ